MGNEHVELREVVYMGTPRAPTDRLVTPIPGPAVTPFTLIPWPEGRP